VTRPRAIFTRGRIIRHLIRATARLASVWTGEQLAFVIIHQVLAEFLLRREGPTAHMARADLSIAPLNFYFRHGAFPLVRTARPAA